MNTVERARLEKLIAFLEDPVACADQSFDLGQVARAATGKCPTVACAIGWTPALFPDVVRWERTSEDNDDLEFFCTNYSDSTSLGYAEVACHLFGIPVNLAENLFAPLSQKYVHSTLTQCNYDCLPEEFAKMLRDFIALVDCGTIDFSAWEPNDDE